MNAFEAPLEARFDEDGLCLLESVHGAAFRMDWTRQDFDKVIAPLRGRGRLIERRKDRETEHPLSPGSVSYVERGACHRIRDSRDRPLHLYVLCLRADFPFGRPRDEAPLSVVSGFGAATVANALAAIREIAVLSEATKENAATDTSRRRYLRRALAALLVARLRYDPADTVGMYPGAKQRVRRSLRDLETNFHAAGSLDEAAAAAGLSRRRFTELFAELAGESYTARLRRLRVRHARFLMLERGRSATAAAFECGFRDLSTFYRAFKRETGLPPKEWLQRSG